jgi:hypothetical protein
VQIPGEIGETRLVRNRQQRLRNGGDHQRRRAAGERSGS